MRISGTPLPDDALQRIGPQPGDLVRIMPEFGRPKVPGPEPVYEYIVMRNGKAGMTHTGRMLPCANNAEGVQPTGTHADNMEIPECALQLMRAAGWIT